MQDTVSQEQNNLPVRMPLQSTSSSSSISSTISSPTASWLVYSLSILSKLSKTGLIDQALRVDIKTRLLQSPPDDLVALFEVHRADNDDEGLAENLRIYALGLNAATSSGLVVDDDAYIDSIAAAAAMATENAATGAGGYPPPSLLSAASMSSGVGANMPLYDIANRRGNDQGRTGRDSMLLQYQKDFDQPPPTPPFVSNFDIRREQSFWSLKEQVRKQMHGKTLLFAAKEMLGIAKAAVSRAPEGSMVLGNIEWKRFDVEDGWPNSELI